MIKRIAHRRSARRRALGLAQVNAALWSAGNALTTGSFVVYLMLDLGADGRWISVILALPAMVGLLRLLTPQVVAWAGSQRRACIWSYAVSYLLLLTFPLLATQQHSATPTRGVLGALVALLCVHQLFEHIGNASLWSWLGELIPPRVRGRYLGWRQTFQMAAIVPAIVIGAWIADLFRDQPDSKWLGYAIPLAAGALLLLASIIPLFLMPARILWGREVCLGDAPQEARRQPRLVPRALPWWRPFADQPYRRLILYGCWVAAANGMAQTSQNIYPRTVLALGILPMELLRMVTRGGQIVLSPSIGRWVDRYGNRLMLLVCQAIVATGSLFYWAARPGSEWWILGAWIAWSAYAGINLATSNLTIKLAPRGNSTTHLATYFAVTGLSYSLFTLVGGWCFEWIQAGAEQYTVGPWDVDRFGYQFLIAFVLRGMGVLFVLGLIDPGASSLREILRIIVKGNPSPVASEHATADDAG